MNGSDDGHRHTFHVPEVPWHKKTEEEKAEIYAFIDKIGRPTQSKPYLKEVRELLMQIMSDRYNPKRVWERASEALRLIDTEERDG